jgi:hypothetical protein
MEYRLDEHAAAQMRARRISAQLVDDVLQNPGQFVPGRKGRDVYQSKVQMRGKAFLLRIIVQTRLQPALVVSAYITDNVAKYWRNASDEGG